METSHTERRIRRASILIAVGLLVQLGTLTSNHPLAFIAFLMVGCTILAGGIVLYLLSLI